MKRAPNKDASRDALATALVEPLAPVADANRLVEVCQAALATSNRNLARLRAETRAAQTEVSERKNADIAATANARVFGIDAPELSAADRERRCQLEEILASGETAETIAQRDFNADQAALSAALAAQRGAIWTYLTHLQAQTRNDIEGILATLTEPFARLAAIETLREKLIGTAPLRGIDPSNPPWSGRVIATSAVAGIPLRLRGQSLKTDKILSRALEISAHLSAQIIGA